VTYILITQKRFLKARKRLTPAREARLEKMNKVLLAALIVLFVYGVTDYIVYQRQQYKSEFSWKRFIIGKSSCDSMMKS
jgi:predicted MPP superfamily phosphohydrolase